MKKIVVLSLAALLLLALVGVSTRVLSSDAAVFPGKAFLSGALVLTVSGDGGAEASVATAGFGGTALMPGSIIGPSTFTLTNTGSGTGHHVDIKFQTFYTDNPAYDEARLGPNIIDMNSEVVVTQLTYGGVSLLDKCSGTFAHPAIRRADVDGDGVLTMAELDQVVLRHLVPPARGATEQLVLAARIPETTGNGIQGDQARTTITFGLFQEPGQHLD